MKINRIWSGEVFSLWASVETYTKSTNNPPKKIIKKTIVAHLSAIWEKEKKAETRQAKIIIIDIIKGAVNLKRRHLRVINPWGFNSAFCYEKTMCWEYTKLSIYSASLKILLLE